MANEGGEWIMHGMDWDDPEQDPWKWREIIAHTGEVAYGKFFNRKAGFVSLEWFPAFANYRRDGYDFDARWEDELASHRAKKIHCSPGTGYLQGSKRNIRGQQRSRYGR